MEYNKKLSVIIATYNSEKVLEKALSAIHRQTLPQDELEILVMDGMSSDRTREIANEYGCRIIDNPKVEQGNAKMLGMKNASGRYILFVDSDEALENPGALNDTINALEENKNCHVAICSGYKKPEDYPSLSGYISDLGDPFSFFVYNFPKDYRFYAQVLKKRYEILRNEEAYFVFDCDLQKCFPLIEGGCGGIVMDMEYYDEHVPECRNSISTLYHSFYLMCEQGDTNVIYMKNSPLAHYSSDRFAGYFRKLKWRICNNIHFTEKGKEVFSGRQSFQKTNKSKKYLFIPYGVSVVVPFLHSIPYAISRKNPVYLMHCIFAFYVVVEIFIQYARKIVGRPPAFVTYGSGDKINK
ncbi:MAG: glycosyltransferase family 2 protein [Lachnospiraceae bacterium]|nr:glycosyltransferase family 2 protein [Lachnospiraceae bacterium]